MNGIIKSELVKELRLSRLVTFRDEKYYWSSPEALLVVSGREEIECVKPEEYSSLTE